MTTYAKRIAAENAFEETIAKLFNLERLDQRGGQTVDFRDTEGKTYEQKCDRWAMRNSSPSFYAEVAQSLDYGATWTPSGLSVQMTRCDFLLLVHSPRPGVFEILKVPSEAVMELLQGDYPMRQTRPGVNANAANRFSRGLLIPFSILANAAVETWTLPPEVNPLDPLYCA